MRQFAFLNPFKFSKKYATYICITKLIKLKTMNTLIINAHPFPHSKESSSLTVLNYFLSIYKELTDENSISQINLYESSIPALDPAMLTTINKLQSGGRLTDNEQNLLKRRDELISQFKEAKRIILVMPLHNFNISSKVKDYIDNIFVARETFKYVAGGSVGLLDDGRKVLVVQSSGSIYDQNDRYTPMDHSSKYLESIFNFMGFDEYHILRIQGLAINDRDEILTQAFNDAEYLASEMAAESCMVS